MSQVTVFERFTGFCKTWWKHDCCKIPFITLHTPVRMWNIQWLLTGILPEFYTFYCFRKWQNKPPKYRLIITTKMKLELLEMVIQFRKHFHLRSWNQVCQYSIIQQRNKTGIVFSIIHKLACLSTCCNIHTDKETITPYPLGFGVIYTLYQYLEESSVSYPICPL